MEVAVCQIIRLRVVVGQEQFLLYPPDNLSPILSVTPTLAGPCGRRPPGTWWSPSRPPFCGCRDLAGG